MESVEVWMWLIAGIMVGSMIFVGAYQMIANYTRNLELKDAQDSFSMLRTSMDIVCNQAVGSTEAKDYLLPLTVEKLYVTDNELTEGVGSKICLDVKGANAYCAKLLCRTTMSTLATSQKDSIFYFIQKALGQKKPIAARFLVSKSGLSTVNASWTMSYAKT